MTEKKTATDVKREWMDEFHKDKINNSPWSPLRDTPDPKPQIVCGICGKSTPYAGDGKDIIFIHKCEPDREYLDTMKKITFKLLGIDSYNQMMQQVGSWNTGMMPEVVPLQEVLKTMGVPPDEIERQRLENEEQGEKMMKAIRKANNKNMSKEEIIKEFNNLNEEFQEYKKAKK